MRTLFITNHFLDGNSGGSFASRAYINAFAALSSEITLLYPCNAKDISSHISNKVKLKGIKYDKNRVLKLLDVFLGKINRFTDIAIQEAIKLKADLIVYDNSRSSAGTINQLKKLGFKVITIHHNYEMEYYKACKPPIYGRQSLLRHIKNCEKNAVLKSDLNLTLTAQDIELLQKHYDKDKKSKFKVIGVFEFQKSIERYEPIINLNNKIKFIISGTLNSEQTETSIFPFLNKYYPIIEKNFPNNELIITGANPGEKLIHYCQSHNNIQLIPNPENMNEQIAKADYYICPISVGGGLKLRILDGLRLGLPIITHEVSARGFEFLIEKEIIFSYKNEESFAKELKKMINSKQDRNFNIENYNNYYSLNAGIKKLKKIINDIN